MARRAGKERIPAQSWIKRAEEIEQEEKELGLRALQLDVEQKERMVKLQSRLLLTFVVIFAVAFLFTIGILTLQGLHLWGFDLDITSVRLLAGATIGELASLLVIGLKFLYRGNDNKND